jgi:hypothetical protein
MQNFFLSILLMASLTANGFMVGVIASHPHAWYGCPVCQHCDCDCHAEKCEQCR